MNGDRWEPTEFVTMTMTMTHSEKSHICQMKAWPYRQECRGHDSTKKNLFCWWSLLIGKVCKHKLLRDRMQCNKSWDELKVQGKDNKDMNHRLLLCWIHKLISESSDSEQHHRQNNKKSGRQEAGRGRTGKPGDTKAPGGRTARYHSTAVVPAVGPNFCSLVRAIFVLQIFPSCWEPVTYFLIVFCPPSHCSWPLYCCCFRRHNALDRCAAAALFKDHVASFLSFYTFHCVSFFKSSPFIPIFRSVDPIIVVLNLSFDWFIFFFFFKILFEKIVDVIFPSFPWSTDRSVGPISWTQLWVPFSSFFWPSFTRWCCNSQCQFPLHSFFCVFCSSIES